MRIIIIMAFFLLSGAWLSAQVQLTSIKKSDVKFKIPIAQRELAGQTGYFQEYGDLSILMDSLGIVNETIDSIKYNETTDSLTLYTSVGVYKTLIPGSSGGIDSTVVTEGWGIDVTESPLNTFTVKADTSQLATQHDISGFIFGTGAATRVAYWNGTNSLSSNSLFFWNNTQEQLGIGTNTPNSYIFDGYNGLGIYDATSARIGMANSSRTWIQYLSGNEFRIYNSSSGESFAIESGAKWRGNAYVSSGTNKAAYFDVNGTLQRGDYDVLDGVGIGGYVARWFDTNTQSTGGLYFPSEAGNQMSLGTTSPATYLQNGTSKGLAIHDASGDPRLSLSNNTRHWLFYLSGNDLSLWNNNSADLIRFDDAGKIGIISTNPQRTLHVQGEMRVTDLITDTPTKIIGADGDGDLGTVTIGTGLNFSSGTISNTGDLSTTNELQTLSWSSPNLSISSGNSVTLPVLPSASSSQTLAYLSGTWTASSFLKTNSSSTTTGNSKRVTINDDVGGESWPLSIHTATKFLVNGRVQINSTASTAVTSIMGRNDNMEVGNVALANDMELTSGVLTKKQVLGVLARSSGSSSFSTSSTPAKLDFNQAMVTGVNSTASTANDDIVTTVSSYGAYEITCDCQFNAGATATYNFGIYVNGSLNGSLVKQIPMTSGNTHDVIITGYVSSLATTDEVDIRVSTTSGTSGNTIGRCLLALKGI